VAPPPDSLPFLAPSRVLRSEQAIAQLPARRCLAGDGSQGEADAVRRGLLMLRQNVVLLRDAQDPNAFYPVSMPAAGCRPRSQSPMRGGDGQTGGCCASKRSPCGVRAQRRPAACPPLLSAQRFALDTTSSFAALEQHWRDELLRLHNDYFHHRQVAAWGGGDAGAQRDRRGVQVPAARQPVVPLTRQKPGSARLGAACHAELSPPCGPQDSLWRKQSHRTLPPLMGATDMLVCGEDLGMIPACVHPVMQELGLIGGWAQRGGSVGCIGGRQAGHQGAAGKGRRDKHPQVLLCSCSALHARPKPCATDHPHDTPLFSSPLGRPAHTAHACGGGRALWRPPGLPLHDGGLPLLPRHLHHTRLVGAGQAAAASVLRGGARRGGARGGCHARCRGPHPPARARPSCWPPPRLQQYRAASHCQYFLAP
jgi:hypothetical protein